MRLGVSSFAYYWAIAEPVTPRTAVGPLDLLARAVELGVGVLQFGDNMPLDRLAEADLAALRRAADDLGVRIEVGMRGLSLELIRRYIRIAADLGSPMLRLVTDTAEQEPSRDEIVATLVRLAPQLQAAGVVLAIENHNRFKSAELREMVEAVASPCVGVCLDTVNSLVALEDPYTATDMLADYTVNLHLKDVRARRDETGLGVVIEGVPAGRGQVDIPWILARLRAAGRDPNAILEQWVRPLARREATLEREAAWAQESISYLRTLISD